MDSEIAVKFVRIKSLLPEPRQRRWHQTRRLVRGVLLPVALELMVRGLEIIVEQLLDAKE